MKAAAKRPPILIVEDEPLVLMVAMDIIDDLGFKSVPAPDAEHALSILESRDDIRAVFTDINMPGAMNGVELAHMVKSRWPPIKLLIVTGQPLAQPSSLPAGSAFLKKPYSLRAVENSLHEIFA
jgi:two-component system, response regulator PdtaR